MSGRQRAHVRQLERRRDRLAERLTTYRVDGSDSYTRAECGALTWALQVVRAAGREGILTDLEAVAA